MKKSLLSVFHLSTALLVTILWALPIPAVAAEALKHLSMEEIVVVESVLFDPQATVVGTKTIEKHQYPGRTEERSGYLSSTNSTRSASAFP